MKRFTLSVFIFALVAALTSCLTARNTGDPAQVRVLSGVVKRAEIGKGQFAKCFSIGLLDNTIMVGDYHRSTVHIFDWVRNMYIGPFGSGRDISVYDKPWWEKVPANRFVPPNLSKELQEELAKRTTFRAAAIYMKDDGSVIIADDFVDLYLQNNDLDVPAFRIFQPGIDQMTGTIQAGFVKNLYNKAGKPLAVTYNNYARRFVLAEEISNSVMTVNESGEDAKNTTEYKPPIPTGIISSFAKLVATKEPVTNLDIIRNMGDGAGEFRLPISVASYRDQIYVADNGNNRIQIFTPEGKHLANLNGRDGVYTWFEHPRAVAVDGTGGIFVLTENNVVIFNARLECVGTFGQGDLVNPHQLAIYSTNETFDVFVTDSNVNAVLHFGLKDDVYEQIQKAKRK